jgi:hypothetical protein
MAEFKLGRIRFVWKAAWITGTTYYKDDVIRFGGKVYVCQVGHTASADFNTDLDINPTKWNLMSDGQRWRDEWTAGTTYEESDLVKYGGTIYICIDGHTSAATTTLGLEANSGDWNQFVEGTDWKGVWNTSTRYKLNDIVRYGGINYICITGHTSAATAALGLEDGSVNWQVFTQGQEYLGTWVTATRYKLNDIVKYGAGLWICTTQHTAAAAFATDSANWAQYVEGFEYENEWNPATAYQPGDVVKYGGNNYIAKTQHTDAFVPSSVGSANWDLFSEGLSYQGDWSNTVSYGIGEVVKLNGYNYLAIADSPSTSYTVTAVTASNDQFTIASTNGISVGMTVRFTGSAIGDVFVGARYYVKTVSAGFITISTTLGGTTYNVTANDSGAMTATVSAEPPNTAYWAAISHGIFWKGNWTDDVEYNIGDAVKYGSNSYICVLGHRSESDDGSTVGPAGGGQANSRPDLDTTGTYWNALTIGNELSVLTTTGDMVYQGGAGPTRLPVGREGQVLRVSSAGIPEWVTYGEIENVYYVSPAGEDRPYPACGNTIDKPWQTIRYACEQVEKGPRNPQAQYLLELNRAFIQKEISDWIRAQIAGNIAPFTTLFDYDEYKCERDVGFIIDRLIWDIGHGGNLKMRAAAFSLLGAFGEAGEFSAPEESTPYATLVAEKEEGVAAYTYMLTLVDAVLRNQPPAVSYQTVLNDSTAIVAQYINTDYVAETGVMADVTELVGIVITALTDLETTNLPARRVPNNTINIKTGQYRETLPIIVPAETALVGDEKRSTNAGPAGSLISKDDARYSMGALGRLETVVGQIILGTNVTESAGNTEVQSSAFPFASLFDAVVITRLVRTIQHQIDFKIGTNILETITNPTGYNVGFLSGFGDARSLLRENKDFLKDEITAFIAANYPSVKYSKTKCRRDIGFIVDAVCYDLTYGGSYQTLTAGLAYFDGNNSTALQIDSTEVAATAASYSRLKTVMQQIIANTAVTPTAGNTATQWTDSTNLTGGASANATVGSLVDIIINIIQGDSTASLTPQINITTIASNTTFTSTGHTLAVGDAVVPRTTANGLTAGVKYWVAAIATNTFTLAATYGGSALTSFTNGTGLDLDFEVIDYPTATNAVTSTTALIAAAVTLDAAQETIVTNATSFISTNYPTLVYNSAKCQRDVRLILEAVMFDFMFNSNSLTRTAAYSYLRSSASDVFSLNQKAATRAAFSYVATQAAANVGGDATAQARISTLMTMLDDIVYGATNEGSVCQTALRSADWARLQLERNRAYIVAEITAYGAATYTTSVTATTDATDVFTCADTSWMQRNAPIRFTGTVFGGVSTGTTYYIQNVVSSTTFKIATSRNTNTAFDASAGTGTMTVSLYYPVGECERDVNAYIDALKFDLQYPGNYKSRLAARYYANAVTGSLEEDMYYLRNGTGIRNQTLQGLTGDLLAENDYGTSRVSAGAYCSLDPGWGPDDFRTWIIGRSPYVQNVATFGYAAIGQKIDGALHNGGNDSIVSNDFTQIISDGIGAWVTNNGRAELVSVFTYYAHIGYLSENGGRIRGTNGNNSYGDFGSVAEGFDATETPILCDVDNKAFRATVGSVITDGIDKIYQFEYDNAGTDYTELVWSVSGGGAGVETEQDDFRDGAVFQVRLLDNVDDSTTAPEADGNFGGIGYISNANTAQSGTTTQLTLAATDDEITGAYVGMKLIITAGAGAGQVGIVSAFTAGTKVATVNKESTGAAGWDHLVPGTAIVAPDASSTYIVEPRASFTSPTYSSTTRTLATAQTYTDATYAPTFAVYSPISSTTSGSGTSATFTVVRKGTKYTAVNIVAAGTGYARFNTVTIAGTNLGGASTANDITITVTAVNSTTGAITAFDYVGVGAGGRFVAVSSGSRTTNTSVNGTTWSENLLALPSTSNWTSVAAGKLTVLETAGGFVTGRSYRITSLGNTVFTSVGAAANLVGTYFVATGAGTGTGTATPIANHLVAVSSSTTVNAYSTNGGVTWTAGGSLPGGISGTAVSVVYGDSRWVALGSGGASAYSTTGGVLWVAGGAVGSGTYTSIAYGQGVFVAITTGATTTRISTNGGETWTAGGALPASSTWISITYGANKFVAVSSDGAVDPAYSVDGGVTWSSAGETGYLGSGTITSVHYGQGVFVVTASSGNNMSSSEDGINWTTRAITRASGTGALAAIQGNPNQSGIWAIIPSGSTTAASSAVLGATAKARVFVSENKIFAIRVTDPGSAYAAAPTITITDPNNLFEAPTQVRIGNGACANVSFINRGTGFDSAIVEQDTGDGFANNFQSGKFLGVRLLTGIPKPGANVVLASQPNTVYKLVQVLSESGEFDGARSAFFQISPEMSVFNSPADGTDITTRVRYSQVRLTGHDFLDIGTGNFVETNYPGLPTQIPVPANETVDNNGGRVFFTSTDQDGNFRVGDLFSIEQSTGVATLNADAFNIAGLSELSLGNITLGGNSATITEFSTDPFLTANSDNVVPTQRAIRAYISAQIGGGGAALNVNSLVAGFIEIAGTRISTTTGGTIQMKANFNFQAGVRGYPVAWNYFLNN